MCDDADEMNGSSLSRRALLIAGAALVAAGCSGRTSMDPMSGVAVRPGEAPRAPTGRSPAPTTPDAPIREPAPIAADGYSIVQRKSWTTQPVKPNNNPMGTVTRITVHHTGEHGAWDGLPDIEIVQRIERYHRNEKDWAAIGYHFLVGKDGKVYEGRPARFQGAHVSTQNENNLGISVIGDFMAKQPSSRQLATLRAILDDKRREYGVGLGRVYGHRDLHASQCPGDALYAWLKKYKTGQV